MSKKYHLMLFIAGEQPISIKAEKNLREICNKYIVNDYELNIVDILEEPDIALDNSVFLTPMLIIATPVPPTYLSGDLSNTDKVLASLKIKEE